MRALVAGDWVVSLAAAGSAPTLERVILNQHRRGDAWAPLLRLETARGAALTVTPDHVLMLDGAFTAAARAAPGSLTSAGAVVAIRPSAGSVVNPVTTSGTILVSDAAAPREPVLAATHPEWVAPLLLAAPSLVLPATRLASRVAPATTQVAYEALEPALAAATPHLQRYAAVAPATLPAGVAVADAGFAVAVLAYALAVPFGLTGVALILVARK